MTRRKLRLYGDADIDTDLEKYLRQHKRINYTGARDIRLSARPDTDHYRHAFKDNRVLVTHDDGYLNNHEYPIIQTHGVLVLKRGSGGHYVQQAFERLLKHYWGPVLSDDRRTLGYMKLNLSVEGFHYWGRTVEGQQDEGYHEFRDF